MTFKKGYTPHNKGKKGIFTHSEKSKRKISEGKSGSKHHMYGKHQSEEWKKKMSKKMSGEKNPMYGKRITGSKHHMYGKHHKEKSKRKMSLSSKGQIPHNKGKPSSSVSKRKNSETNKKLFADGRVHPMKGKRHKEKSLKIMRLVKLGEKNVRYGTHHTKSTKRKISLGNIGKTLSKETKRKISLNRVVPPSKNTEPEKLLQSLCKREGIKFQKQKNFDLGFKNHRVDLFIEPNICIEGDGDWIHANPNPYLKHGRVQRGGRMQRSSRTQHGFKANDIMRNVSRYRKKPLLAKDIWEDDKKITQGLVKQGNIVLRFWQGDLIQNPEKYIQKIIKIIKESRHEP